MLLDDTVAANPSFNPVEVFPTESWEDPEIVDFFANRFNGERRQWIRDLRVLQHDGTHGAPTQWVRFWAACKGRATELLGRPAVDGIDYAMAEVVHCKSKGERVFAEAVTKDAARTCADRYLRREVGLSPARVIVSFGGIADAEIRRVFALTPGRYAEAEGRHFVFADHPAGFGKFKTMAAALAPDQLANIRSSIATRA